MSTMRKWGLTMVVALLAAWMLSGCLKESDDPNHPDQTIVLFGEEGYVKGFEEVFFGRDSLAPPIDAALLSHVVCNEGIEPPDIRGEFEFAIRKLVYPEDSFEANDAVYFRFGGDFDNWDDYLHGQHHLITHCDILIPGLGMNAKAFHTDTAYIIGYGHSFTAYLSREQEVEALYGNKTVRYILSQGIAISGLRTETVTETGRVPGDIHDARLMLYNQDISMLNASELPQEVVDNILLLKGKLFVYMDADSVTVFNTGEHPFVNWNE